MPPVPPKDTTRLSAMDFTKHRVNLDELVLLEASGKRVTMTGKVRPAAGRRGAEGEGGGRKPVRPLPPLPADSPWRVDGRKFPRGAGRAAALRFCLQYAVLAPSSHNSQPWRFAVKDDVCELRADRTRALPVADPADRELTISCGAALLHLRLALRRFGFAEKTTLLPVKADPDLLARVKVGREGPEQDEDDAAAFRAILDRRTNRLPYQARPVPAAVLKELEDLARQAGATLHVVTGDVPRQAMAKLIAEADTVQFASAAFRRELALWMHHNRSQHKDGVPGAAMGMSELASLVAPLVVRTFDVGGGRAARDEQLALGSPVLAILGTPGDAPRDWLHAGVALAAVVLRATALGVAHSYLNQPVEVPSLRPRLSTFADAVGHAQLVLRLGYPEQPVAHTPRRSVEDVLIHEPIPTPPRRRPI